MRRLTLKKVLSDSKKTSIFRFHAGDFKVHNQLRQKYKYWSIYRLYYHDLIDDLFNFHYKLTNG
jgi:hypothetical protein